MKKKTHDWIRMTNNTEKFVMPDGSENEVISKAKVFRTRHEARTSSEPYRLKGIDVVYKVSLTKTGKAKKIIGRG